MKLDKIVFSGRDGNLAALHFDDGSVVKSYYAVTVELGLSPDMEVGSELYDNIITSTGNIDVRELAVKILSRRSLSKRELEKRLVERGASGEQAGGAAEWLESIGVLNDADYASMLVQRFKNKGYGERRIKSEFYNRGIPRDLWDEAFEALDITGEMMDSLVMKKLKNYSGDKKELKRAADWLLRRGFSWGEVNSALRRFESSWEGED